MARFIGLMSGTSLDGVDSVLVDSEGSQGPLRELAFVHLPFDPALRDELLALNATGPDELHRAALAGTGLSRVYAQAVAQLLAEAGLSASQVDALGAHGQTVRHRPREFDGVGYTLQLLNGSMLAELTGVDVVCDLRSRDLAAGGIGAPLVPAFHAAVFAQAGRDVAVLNLGGIANLTLLPAAGAVGGFDCGPGNVLMDLWIQRHRHKPYDENGQWAASGRVDSRLLLALLAEPFMSLAPPKSTGRDLFNAPWLDARLAAARADLPAADIMATLAEFTARGAVDALLGALPTVQTLLVCGGGAFNAHLMSRLAQLAPADVHVHATSRRGVAPDRVESLAFAWLARAHRARRSGNLPEVTGARGPRVLGALYPA
jgi:anhydro-N-acetylmuramic acid kinase